MEVSEVFRQDRIQQCFVEQTDEIPDVSIDEKIVERLVTQMQGKTQQVVNTRVQTTEVLLQFIDKVVDIPVVAMRQTPQFPEYHRDSPDSPVAGRR